MVTSDEVRTWLIETDWRRVSAGCVAVREWRGFGDTEDVGDVRDVVDMTDDAESLPLTLVCGVGRVDEGEPRGEADIMGLQECVVYCRYRTGFAYNTGAGRSSESRKRAKNTRPNSARGCVTRGPVLLIITKDEQLWKYGYRT